jgi:hypothetical protein
LAAHVPLVYDALLALRLSRRPLHGGDLLRAQQHRRHAVDERHAHDYQLNANLFVTMQEEIGTARRMVRVSRDALMSELPWAVQCCDNCLAWEEYELPSGRFARLATGADIVLWICQLVGARDGEHAFAMAPVVPPDRIDGPPPDGARRARRAPRRADAGRRRCRCRYRWRRARVGVADGYILL